MIINFKGEDVNLELYLCGCILKVDVDIYDDWLFDFSFDFMKGDKKCS